MKATNKQLIYVSGPPCAGKSSICLEIVKTNHSRKYILGDEHWILNVHDDFPTRVEKTNQAILSSIKENNKERIILEWVPSFGSFVESLKYICKTKEYDFIHIVIYAPKKILEQRKLERDGDMDLGLIDIEKYRDLMDVITFDSSKQSIDSIVYQCVKKIDENILLE